MNTNFHAHPIQGEFKVMYIFESLIRKSTSPLNMLNWIDFEFCVINSSEISENSLSGKTCVNGLYGSYFVND